MNYEKTLKNRILELMEDETFLEMVSKHDWKQIYWNVISAYPQGNITDAEINSEIKIFYGI